MGYADYGGDVGNVLTKAKIEAKLVGVITTHSHPGGSGSGDVVGPATNTDSYLPQWNGADSKTLKNGLAVPAGGLAGLTALSGKLGTALNSGNIFVGNSSNVATGVTLSGDGALSNTGLLGVNKVRLNVRNETGTTIASTKVVYVSGFNNLPLIALGDNTVDVKYNVIGLTVAPIADQSDGYIAVQGQCDAETNSWNVGDELYLTTAGGLVNAEPTIGVVTHIGIVTVKQNYPAGKILLYRQPESNIMASVSGEDIILRLGDNAGANKVSIRDYANNEVASINSNGEFTGTFNMLTQQQVEGLI